MRVFQGTLIALCSSLVGTACDPPGVTVVMTAPGDDAPADHVSDDDVPDDDVPDDDVPDDDAPTDTPPEAPDDDAVPAIDPPGGDAPTVDDVPADPPAPSAFIGGACTTDDGCLSGGFCLDDGEGFPHGSCSLACTRLCPDDPAAPTTFCVDDPTGTDGLCVSRCDVARLGGDGCREGYRCLDQARHGEPGTVRDVCWPDDVTPPTTPPPSTPPPSTPPPSTTPPPAGDNDRCSELDLPLDNAGLVEPAGVDGCPDGMAPIAGTAVCMDRWEAFLEEEHSDGSVGPFSPYRHPGAAVVVARSAPGAVPQGYISGHEAKAACTRAGKRLCGETEWSRACRGEAAFIYPWGNDRRDGVCNDARAVHPAVEYFGTGADWIWSRLGHPCINQLDDSVALTGEHAGCVGPSGHFDLMGNVHEWVADPAGTFRGGFYVDTVRNGAGCTYRTTAHDLGHWDYSTGFRCCADRR